MGISEFWDAIKAIERPRKCINELNCHVVAIDASIWLVESNAVFKEALEKHVSLAT